MTRRHLPADNRRCFSAWSYKLPSLWGEVMSFHPTVSIIVNTDGRAESLKSTLDSLCYQDYPSFEVCAVYGPTPDGTKQLLEERSSEIKISFCPTRNISASRNIGIGFAAGEIVAFLDDDSIPVPEWLGSIVGAFADPMFPPPSVSVYEASKHAWVQLPDGIKHSQRGFGAPPVKIDVEPLITPLINTLRHYTKPRVRENNGCWSSRRVNASISGRNQRSGIVGIRS